MKVSALMERFEFHNSKVFAQIEHIVKIYQNFCIVRLSPTDCYETRAAFLRPVGGVQSSHIGHVYYSPEGV
jgi:hypothetical protein